MCRLWVLKGSLAVSGFGYCPICIFSLNNHHHRQVHSSLTTTPPIPPVKMKFTTSVAFLGVIATTSAQIFVPTGPVRGPNTLVFKQINGVPNNECLTFTNDVCPPTPTPPPPPN